LNPAFTYLQISVTIIFVEVSILYHLNMAKSKILF
jgi:hypothetical protein